jgi:hypothetical protein
VPPVRVGVGVGVEALPANAPSKEHRPAVPWLLSGSGIGYGGAIGIAAALTAASCLWVLADMPARARASARPTSPPMAAAP